MSSLLKKRSNPEIDEKIEEISELELENIESTEEGIGCLCAKSKCLKLYCACFAKGKYCAKDCRCKGCHNFIGNKVNNQFPFYFSRTNKPIFFPLTKKKFRLIGSLIFSV